MTSPNQNNLLSEVKIEEAITNTSSVLSCVPGPVLYTLSMLTYLSLIAAL